MSKMIEFTAAYDSTDPKLTEHNPVKVLVDLSAIQAVTMGPKGSPFCEVSLTPSLAAYGDSEAGETVVQDQRVLHVLEPYHDILAVLATHRGIVRCTPPPTK